MESITDLTAMYVGIGVMIFAALGVLWAALTISNFKQFTQKRDEHYMKRIDGIENIVREEFKIISNSLRKL